MKKLILFSLLSLLFIPLVVGASFDNNLYYGLKNNSEVTELQEFLTDEGAYSGPITGNFYFLTLVGVKAFQKREKISPVAGYFGPLTRTRANELLSADVEASNQQAVQETGSTPPTPTPSATTNDIVAQLQAQIELLMQQLQAMVTQQTTVQQLQETVQQQAQTIQQIQQNTQQIVQNTCNPNWQCTVWSTCANSQQTRTCNDSNSCGLSNNKPSEIQSCSMPLLSVSCSGTVASLDDPNYEINFTSNVSGGSGNYQYYWNSGYWGRTEISTNDPKCFISGYPCPSMTFCDKVGTLNEECPMTGGPTFTGKSQSIGPSSINFNIENKQNWYWPEKQRWSTKKDLLNKLETLFVKSGSEIVGVHCPITVTQ